jgi:hypothetical protein
MKIMLHYIKAIAVPLNVPSPLDAIDGATLEPDEGRQRLAAEPRCTVLITVVHIAAGSETGSRRRRGSVELNGT